VCVGDRAGTDRDKSFDTTAAGLGVRPVLTSDTGRGNRATTVPEIRSGWHLETTRGGCRTTLWRGTACRFGRDAVVAAVDNARTPARRMVAFSWPGQSAVRVSEALTAVRRWTWSEGVV
jgi:hypothetical protein